MRQRRAANFDDDDDGLFDPAYPGLKVVRDGGRVRVPLALTDGMPDITPPRRAVFDARNHRPRFAVLGDAELQDAQRRAAEARQEYIARNCNAWRDRALSWRLLPCPARPRGTLMSGVFKMLGKSRLAEATILAPPRTSSERESSGFPLARGQGWATRDLLFHEKRRRASPMRALPATRLTTKWSSATPTPGGRDD
jgi:hypothetical protein